MRHTQESRTESIFHDHRYRLVWLKEHLGISRRINNESIAL